MIGFDKAEAKFLDARLDDNTAAVLSKCNLAILAATLMHDGDHFYQAYRWKYRIPLELLAINLAVYVLPSVSEFLIKNKRSSSFMSVVATGVVTSAAFLKVHLWAPSTNIWGVWNNNYFKLNKGVWHDGKFMKGINWIDWALLFILPAVSAPACITALKKRKEFKEELSEEQEED